MSIPDCDTPATQVSSVAAAADGTASIDATFLAARWGDALDPTSVSLEALHGATPAVVTPSAVPSQGTIHLDLSGLPPGKSTLALHASDVKGRAADAGVAVVWTQPQTFDWRDAVIYEVMVDRYRAQGRLAARAARVDGRTGRRERRRRPARRSSRASSQSLGVNTIWLSPLYANPDGEWPGPRWPTVQRYHGYWPSERARLEPTMADEPDVDALDRVRARARHAHPLRRRAAPRPHAAPVLDRATTRAAGSSDPDGSCVCGVGSCSWATTIIDCWFTPYLPDARLDEPGRRRPASRATSLWWIDRFDGDGIRIDAVPMMPRARRCGASSAATAGDATTTRRTAVPPRRELRRRRRTSRRSVRPRPVRPRQRVPLPAHVGAPGGVRERERVARRRATRRINTGEATGRDRAPSWASSSATTTSARFSLGRAPATATATRWTPAPQSTDPDGLRQSSRLALGVLFALPGAPTLYYGDEVALAGGDDPDSRRVMPADARAVRAAARRRAPSSSRSAAARACSGALRRGTYRTLYVDRRDLVFAREAPGETRRWSWTCSARPPRPCPRRSRESQGERGSTS